MKTTPRTGRSASARTASTWRTISDASRLREKPSAPVAQKAQARAQPACEETQTMYFFSLPSYALVSAPGASQGTGMRTASTSAPSCRWNRYFTKPSGAVLRSAMRSGSAVDDSSMRRSTSLRTPRTPARSRSPRCTAAARIFRATSSRTPKRRAASSARRPQRWSGAVIESNVSRHRARGAPARLEIDRDGVVGGGRRPGLVSRRGLALVRQRGLAPVRERRLAPVRVRPSRTLGRERRRPALGGELRVDDLRPLGDHVGGPTGVVLLREGEVHLGVARHRELERRDRLLRALAPARLDRGSGRF